MIYLRTNRNKKLMHRRFHTKDMIDDSVQANVFPDYRVDVQGNNGYLQIPYWSMRRRYDLNNIKRNGNLVDEFEPPKKEYEL